MAPFNITYNYTDANTTALTFDEFTNETIGRHDVAPFKVDVFPCNSDVSSQKGFNALIYFLIMRI